MQKIAQVDYAAFGISGINVVERGKEAQVLLNGQPGVKAGIGSAVKPQLPKNARRLTLDIGATDPGAAAGGQQQSSQNAQERRFAGAVCANERQNFARLHARKRRVERA